MGVNTIRLDSMSSSNQVRETFYLNGNKENTVKIKLVVVDAIQTAQNTNEFMQALLTSSMLDPKVLEMYAMDAMRGGVHRTELAKRTLGERSTSKPNFLLTQTVESDKKQEPNKRKVQVRKKVELLCVTPFP